MLKRIFASSSVVALLLMCHLPAQAQTQTPTSQPQQPISQPQEPQTSETQVSPQELQKFAKAVKLLLPIQREANQKITSAIQEGGLSKDRFTEIFATQHMPQVPPATPISQDEKQKFTRTLTKVTAIQEQEQPKMKEIVQNQGLDVPRFNQIQLAVQQNPTLLQQVLKLIQS